MIIGKKRVAAQLSVHLGSVLMHLGSVLSKCALCEVAKQRWSALCCLTFYFPGHIPRNTIYIKKMHNYELSQHCTCSEETSV